MMVRIASAISPARRIRRAAAVKFARFAKQYMERAVARLVAISISVS